MSHPAASRIPLYIGEVYKPCVSGLFLDDIRLATCPVESHRVGLSDASHNTLDTQPLFKFFLVSSDSEALIDTMMNELIHQMSGQAAPLGNGRLRDFPATDPAPDSTLLIVYSLLIIESRDAGFARRDPEELRREDVEGFETVGLTGGSSTPNCLINNTEKLLLSWFGDDNRPQ